MPFNTKQKQTPTSYRADPPEIFETPQSLCRAVKNRKCYPLGG